MFRKCLAVVMVFAVSLGCAAAYAANVDLATGTNEIPPETDDNYNLYSEDGTVAISSTGGKNVDLENGNTLTIGKSDVNTGEGFTLDLKQITITDGGGGNLVVVSASNGTATDVTVRLGGLTLNPGGNATFGETAAAGVVNVTASTLAADGNGVVNMTFNKNATVKFTGVTGNKLGGDNAVNLNMNGGAVGFGSSTLTLANGVIDVNESSYLAVNGTLTVHNATNAANATIDIAAGKELTILKNLDDTTSRASLVIGGTGGGGTLAMGDDASKLIVDKLTFGKGSVLTGASAGTIEANTLVVSAERFEDARDVVTKVTDLTTIEKNSIYVVKGLENEYSGGMLVKGVLQGDNDITKITLGREGALKELQIDGGSIAAGAVTGEAFTIDYADINIVNATTPGGALPMPSTIDASKGKLVLDTSNITVRLGTGTPATIKADRGIGVNDYSQLAGNVEISTTATGEKMIVNGDAVIGSADASRQAAFDVTNHAVQFATGLTLDKYGAVTTQNGGTVDIGSANTDGSGVITANGNNQLYAATGKTLTFKDLSRDQTGRMSWSGLGNTVYGDIDQSAFAVSVRPGARVVVATDSATNGYEVGSLSVYGRMTLGSNAYPGLTAGTKVHGILESHGNVLVKDGGTLASDYATSFVKNVSADPSNTNVLKIEQGGTLLANTATIMVRDFNSVEINGTFIAGLFDGTTNPVEAARLVANSDINISSTGLITMTADLAKTVTSNDDVAKATKLMEIDNSGGTDYKINNKANMSSKSMLGIFEYALNDSSTILYVKKATGQVSLDGSDEDRNQAWNNLQDIWGDRQVNKDLSDIIYDIINGDIVAEPADSIAGNKNINLLEAIGSPEGKVVGKDTLEYLNGGHLYGVTDVAIQTNRAFMSDITNRAKALGCSFVAARDVSGCDAFASTAMNPVLNNRVWFGGSSLWQNAKEKDDFSGYKYKSYGFSGGFDRVAMQNLAIGAAFAYNKGDYEDKGSFGSDSKIESFSAGLYGTYSNPCGWFLTGHGAYTYSQNDIRELRRDPDAERLSWGEANFHTNTWSLGALFGYDIRLPGEGWTISPSAGINYILAKNSDHQSLLDGVATQDVTRAKNSHIYLPVDLTMQYDTCIGIEGKLRVEANVGYAYNLRGSGMSGSITYIGLSPESSIGIHGRRNAKHSYKAGGGVRYAYRSFDIGLRYDLIARTDLRTHRLMATAGLSF